MKRINMPLLMLSLGIACPLLIAASLPAEPPAPQVEASDKVSLPLDEKNTITLVDLIRFGSKTLDTVFTFDEPMVKDQSFQFSGPVSMPAERFRGFLERILLDHEYLVYPSGGGMGPGDYWRIIKLSPANSRAFRTLKPIYIELDALKGYEDRGLLLATTVPLKHLDARTTLQSLNPHFMQNASIESLRSVDTTNSLILVTTAPKLCWMVRMIRTMDKGDEEYTGPIMKRLKMLEERIRRLEEQVAPPAKK